MRILVVLGLCALLGACATGHERNAARNVSAKERHEATKERKKPHREKPQKDVLAATNPAPEVTLTLEACTLGDAVERIAESTGGSLVLMNGIESAPIGPVDFKRAKFGAVAEQLATISNCKCETYPNYRFLYPAGYEVLLDVTVSGSLDPAHAELRAGMHFGHGTPLFEVFALLGAGLGTTIVADNIVAEARCGSLTLAKIPLQDALDAVLKSARLSKGAFQVESTPEYVFIYATENTSALTALLNADALTPEQNALLDRVVDVFLPAMPEDPARLAIQPGGVPLSKVLGTLSQRLGIAVTAEEGLGEIPVNPVAFNHVRVRTVLDLLIRQWPRADFGYELANNQILIERKK